MKTLEEIYILVHEIRQELSTIIEVKDNLLDAEVIAISQKLDHVLNKYNSAQSEIK